MRFGSVAVPLTAPPSHTTNGSKAAPAGTVGLIAPRRSERPSGVQPWTGPRSDESLATLRAPPGPRSSSSSFERTSRV